MKKLIKLQLTDFVEEDVLKAREHQEIRTECCAGG